MLDVLYSVFQLKVPELTSEYRIAVASIGMSVCVCVCTIYVYLYVYIKCTYKHTFTIICTYINNYVCLAISSLFPYP